MNNREIALTAAKILDDKKAIDIVILDISKLSSFADYILIASGGSERQVKSLTDEVTIQLAALGIEKKGVEGNNGSGWVLIDFGDVIVNIFTGEQRERYGIEKIWGDSEVIEL